MSLPLQDSLFFARKESHLWRNYTFSIVPEVRHIRRWPTRSSNISQTEYCSDVAKERIKKLLMKPEISVSPYDTAWVAMVPSPHSPMKPFFPECVNWLLENQCPDGSWACAHHHHLLHKDVISSTLACVIALKKWAVGEEQMQRGIHFIQSSFDVAFDEHQISPLGFDILFPAMLEYASSLSLNMNLQPDKLNSIRRKRDVQLKSYHSQSGEMELHMAYLAEGTGKSLDWERVMKYQWKNGSLFNCPSTTAAAFIELPNTNCLNYLQSAVKKFGNAVSHTFPLDTFCKLYTVDILESLGISRFFEREIEDVLDETYRGWLRGDEEIFMDPSACSLAFRLLRMHGYHVTSDQVVKSIQDWFSTSNGPVKDNHTALELYKASQLVIYPDELELEKQNLRLKRFLELSISSGSLYSAQLSQNIDQEVKRALQYPFYAIIDGIAKRTNIEHYKLTNTRILKTTYCSPNFACEEFLSLALEDFNNCQQTHRDEVKALESWVINNELDKLKFARQKSVYCYFSVAASIFSPELSDARLSWAKNAILTTVVDDFFDFGGSMEELENLIHLVELWNVDIEAECCSKNVKIIFLALKHMVQEIGDKCYALQERYVINHIIQIWLDLLCSMMKEAEWSIRKTIPTMDDYIQNAYTSFALGPIVLPTLYLIGPKLSESMMQHPEYLDLFRSMSICGRLLNDIHSGDREMEDTVNAVQLLMTNSNGETTKEMAIESIRNMIRMAQMELLRIVVEKRSVIPKPCKEVFLHMVKVVHFFYSQDDGYSSDNMMETARKIIYEPIPQLSGNEGQEIGTSITNISFPAWFERKI